MKKRSEKKEEVTALNGDLARVSTVILTTFQGITVAQDSQLRRAAPWMVSRRHDQPSFIVINPVFPSLTRAPVMLTEFTLRCKVK